MGSGGGPDEAGASAQDFRLQEQRRATAQGMRTNQTQRNFARNIQAAQELEARERQKTRIPGFSGMALDAIGQASISRQANLLRGQSTTAEPVRDDGGQVVGVVSSGLFGGRVYSGRPDMAPDVTPRVTSRVTSRVTPEIVPNKSSDLPSIENVMKNIKSSKAYKTSQQKDRNLLGRGEDLPFSARLLR